MKKLFLIALTLLTSSVCLAQKEKIELRLAKDVTYPQRMSSDLVITQEVSGQTMVIKMGIGGKMTYKILDIINNIYTIEVGYESLSLKMDVQGNVMSYTSENTTDLFGKIFNAITKKKFLIKMDRKGNVVEVQNADNLFDSVFDQFTEIPDAQKKQLKDQLAESYGEKAFKGNLEMSLAIFPTAPVTKGESWNTKTALRSKMAMDIENTFTLKEITDTYYLITCSSILTPDPKAGYVQANGMEMMYNLNGTMNAEIKIDKKTGWVINSNYEQTLNGSTTFKASDQLPEGMVIPMKMVNKMIFSDK